MNSSALDVAYAHRSRFHLIQNKSQGKRCSVWDEDNLMCYDVDVFEFVTYLQR